jgi:hypothetical protein
MCGANNVPILVCEKRHIRGGSTLDPMLVADTKEVTLAWLEEALEHAYSHGQHLALAYLEAVIEDVVFEEEITARTASVLG